MASVDDWVSDAGLRERAELDRLLAEGEDIRWAVRPCVRWARCVRWDMFFFGLVWLSFIGYGTCTMLGLLPPELMPEGEVNTDELPFLIPFWLVGIGFIAAPLCTRWRMKRSLYVLTQQRALVLEPAWARWVSYAWPLNHDLLLLRSVEADGSGSLTFSEARFAGQRMRTGFHGLPDLAAAEARISAILSEQDAARPVQGAEVPTGRVDDYLSDLTARERAELDKALFADETGHILWAGRSQAGIRLAAWKDLALFWKGNIHLRPQLYVLTPRRALVLQPPLLSDGETRAYLVHEDMFIARNLRAQGRGDLIFEEEQGKHGVAYRGFMNLANLAQAEEALQSAIGRRAMERSEHANHPAQDDEHATEATE